MKNKRIVLTTYGFLSSEVFSFFINDIEIVYMTLHIIDSINRTQKDIPDSIIETPYIISDFFNEIKEWLDD